MQILKVQALASKQYISIIRLLEHCGIATGDDINIARVKKQLQAEFDIAQSGFIEADNYNYSRQDVFEELERPDFIKRLALHRQIWQLPSMLQLLENNAFDADGISEAFRPFWSNKPFDEFFSPYFAGPFNYLSRTFLGSMQFADMGQLLTYEDFLQPAEREEAFRPVRMFLDENARLLRNTNGENYKMMRPKIVLWMDTDWHLFFNKLPAEFYDAKCYIANTLINIGVAVQKTHRRDCRKISSQLVLLQDMPEDLRRIITSNHTIYSKSRFRISVRSPFWILWGVIGLFRLVSTNSCDNTTTPTYNNVPTYISPDSSILKTLGDSTSKNRIIDSLMHVKYQ